MTAGVPAGAPAGVSAVTAHTITYAHAGITFSALEWGPADGPLALCLHGYPDTAHSWRHLGPFLAERGWRVVAPFMRGYRPSGLAPDGSYQVGALASDAIAAHGQLGGDSRAVLIGHDWGAIAAYAAASASPGTFARVVTLAVPPLPSVFGSLSLRTLPGELRLVLRQVRMSWYAIFQQLPWLPERLLPRLVRRLWADWSPGYDAREDVGYVLDALGTRANASAALRYYRALARPWTHTWRYAAEQRHWLGVPECPVLYLQGERDGCLQAAFAERARVTLSADSRVVVVPAVGHFLQLEKPDVVNELIAAFV